MEDLSRHPRYEEALRNARAVRGFYGHALTYVLVNAGLVVVNMLSSPGRWWVLMSLGGWGIGLAAHAVSVFAARDWLGRGWEERKVREYLERRG